MRNDESNEQNIYKIMIYGQNWLSIFCNLTLNIAGYMYLNQFLVKRKKLLCFSYLSLFLVYNDRCIVRVSRYVVIDTSSLEIQIRPKHNTIIYYIFVRQHQLCAISIIIRVNFPMI